MDLVLAAGLVVDSVEAADMAGIDEQAIAERWRMMEGTLDERACRRFAAAEARSHGRGGIAAVVRATPVSESTVRRGLLELDSGEPPSPGRVRRPGAGRPPITRTDPTLVADLEQLVEPDVRGDPQSPLRWSSKSSAKLADGLRTKGHRVADRTVLKVLKELGYSLQANAKTREGRQHPDRDLQFRHIAQAVRSDDLHWPHRDVVDSSDRRNAWSSTGRRVVVRKGRWERPSRAFCAGGC